MSKKKSNYYLELKKQVGEDGAKERMRQVRKARKAPGYFATLSKEEITAISRKGGKAEHVNQNLPNGSPKTDSAG